MIDLNDHRLYKPHLARRFACTTRTIDNWWRAGVLPRPHRDEFNRPFIYASEIVKHESELENEE